MLEQWRWLGERGRPSAQGERPPGGTGGSPAATGEAVGCVCAGDCKDGAWLGLVDVPSHGFSGLLALS